MGHLSLSSILKWLRPEPTSTDDIRLSARTSSARMGVWVSRKVGFFVQLTHHCNDEGHASNATKRIPKEYENPEANQGKIFKQDFFIWHY
ncbi:hypothetical protein AAVH_12314 [Aphelenchoides avenae]|nr:hypothetical protein AAVH_12314 [Aphelenchus avenae]